MRGTALIGSTTALLVAGALGPTALAGTDSHGCSPTERNRPVCSAGAAAEHASFLDPTATVESARHVTLGEQTYVGPFAELLASQRAPITVGEASTVQNNVPVAPAGGAGSGVAARVFLAHGSSVLASARAGTEESELPAEIVAAGVDVG